MPNPLLIKIISSVALASAVVIPSGYLINRQLNKKEMVEKKDGNGVVGDKVVKDVPEVDETEQNQCSHSLDALAKEIKTIFINNSYFYSGWVRNESIKDISEADKTLLSQKEAKLKNWKNISSTGCRNNEKIDEPYNKVIEHLKNPDLSKTLEEFREPMKKLLEIVGSTTSNNY